MSYTLSRRAGHTFKVFSQSGAVLGRYEEADGLDSGLALEASHTQVTMVLPLRRMKGCHKSVRVDGDNRSVSKSTVSLSRSAIKPTGSTHRASALQTPSMSSPLIARWSGRRLHTTQQSVDFAHTLAPSSHEDSESPVHLSTQTYSYALDMPHRPSDMI